jgi:hypothetical protein
VPQPQVRESALRGCAGRGATSADLLVALALELEVLDELGVLALLVDQLGVLLLDWAKPRNNLNAPIVEAYIGFYPPLHSAPTSEVPGHPYVHLAERRDSPLGHPTDGAHL